MDPRRDRLGQRSYHEVTGDNICPSMIRGIDFVRDPRLNKVKYLEQVICAILIVIYTYFKLI